MPRPQTILLPALNIFTVNCSSFNQQPLLSIVLSIYPFLVPGQEYIHLKLLSCNSELCTFILCFPVPLTSSILPIFLSSSALRTEKLGPVGPAKSFIKKWSDKFGFWNMCVCVCFIMCLLAIYIFPRSVCLFCCRKICGPILGIYKSLTDTWMRTLGLRPSNSFSGKT